MSVTISAFAEDAAAGPAVSDATLIAAVRAGDTEAYGTLFERHRDAAQRLARQLISGSGADDLVSEAFIKVLGVLQRGGGPDEAFRAYLLTAIRRLHIDAIRSSSRERSTDDENELDRAVEFVDPATMQFERGAAGEAFRSLPERWQLVLWHLDVEGQSPAEIAPLLDMAPNSVSALAYRAREGLRRAYLQQHLAPTLDNECRETTGKLGSYVRHGLAARDTRKVETHLDECARCTGLYLELREVNTNLAGILGPALLGSAATGYLGAAATASTVGLVGASTAASMAFSAKSVLAETARAGGTALAGSAPAAVATAALAGVTTVGVVATTANLVSPHTPDPAALETLVDPSSAPTDDGIRILDTPGPETSAPTPGPSPSPEPTDTMPPTADPTPEPTASSEPEVPEPTPEPPRVVGTDFAVGSVGIVNDRAALQRTLTVPITGTTTGGVPADRYVSVQVTFTRQVQFRSVGSGWTCSASPEQWVSSLTCTTTVPAGHDTSIRLTIVGVQPTGSLTIRADEDPNPANDTVSFTSPSILGFL
ncbi:MAG: sigma-70 family RNA polymerase sigma factor [Aeromicrobium sp.]|uniref:sigma-70 family RNA polymerase sigma factor n=1 Tax=Aeromicrobium sp. TaxID=1871063 RepID=UPI0039E443F8